MYSGSHSSMSCACGVPRKRLTQSLAVLTPTSSTGPSGPGARPAARRNSSSIPILSLRGGGATLAGAASMAVCPRSSPTPAATSSTPSSSSSSSSDPCPASSTSWCERCSIQTTRRGGTADRTAPPPTRCRSRTAATRPRRPDDRPWLAAGPRCERIACLHGLLNAGVAGLETTQAHDERGNQQDGDQEHRHVGEDLERAGHSRELLALEDGLVVDELACEGRGRRDLGRRDRRVEREVHRQPGHPRVTGEPDRGLPVTVHRDRDCRAVYA